MTNLGVVITRCEPFTKFHEELIQYARSKSDQVLILIGSSFRAPNPLNPFNEVERQVMIEETIGTKNLFFDYLDDSYLENIWLSDAQTAVFEFIKKNNDKNYKVTFYGNNNPLLPNYINKFPQWGFEVVKNVSYKRFGPSNITSPTLEGFFENTPGWANDISAYTKHFMLKWKDTEIGKLMFDEYEYTKTYRKNTQKGPYENIFQCVDTLAVYNANILLIKRGASPGKGLWALPGGFLNPKELLFDAALRELEEETGFNINPDWSKRDKTFDYPYRSLRGRIITKVFYFEIPGYINIPAVYPKDGEAEKVGWFPISKIKSEMRRQMFEDHYDIINWFV